MERGRNMRRRGNVAGAILLIGIGVWYLAIAMSPAVKTLAYGVTTWPYQIIALGLLFYLAGLLSWTPGFFIPGSIIAGIGGILYYQNISGNWSSWSYMWTLIPGFVGIGLILFGVLARKFGAIIGGLWNIFGSLVLFSIFGFAFGQVQYTDKIWPAALIMLGLFFLLRAVRKQKVA
jgi:hypothetical protein